MISEHFLSSKAWAEFRRALGEQTIHREADDWNYLGLIQRVLGFKKLYCPYSPTVFSATAVEELFRDLDKTAHQHGAMITQLEPVGEITADDLLAHGYQKTKHIQPELTWVLDLSSGLETIIAGMSATNRNIYRNYRKKGLEVKQTESIEDVDAVLKLLAAVAEHNQVRLHQTNYLRKQAEVLLKNQSMKCFVVILDGQIIAGSLVYDDSTTRYYAHAAADYEHRKLNAGVALLAEMIVDAKNCGLQWFDFYGITDSDDPHHPWAGFTRFKQSFGGQQKRYLGTWQKINRPLLYRIYSCLQKIRQTI